MGLANPQSLMGCIDHLHEDIYRTKHNATVDVVRAPLTEEYENQFQKMAAYTYYNDKIIKLLKPLKALHLQQYISLVQSEGQAAIAIALNAGDGIVVKLTSSAYLHEKDDIMPGRLPPIYRENIDDVIVEIFPWVDRRNITLNEVQQMKEKLKTFGLQFRDGDDRPDNIGRMPNGGELVVLDGDALEPIREVAIDPENYRKMQDGWKQHIQELFYPLYTDPEFATGVRRLISESPDYTESFSPLIVIDKKIGKGTTQPASFIARVFGSKQGNERG